MIKFSGAGCRAAVLVGTIVLGLSNAAQAQNTDAGKEPTKGQIDAGRSAVAALHATDDFDSILPAASDALKHSLIQANPNYELQITTTVDEQALKLASRRGDLEKEVATIYAKAFSTDELKAISDFYHSEAGKKLIEKGPQVTQKTLQAAHIWQNGVARDLATAVHAALQEKLGKDVKGKAPGAAPKAPAAK